MQARHGRALALPLIGILTVTACGQEGVTGPTPPGPTGVAPVARVEIQAADDEVVVGRQVQLTATAYDAAGNVLPGRLITWSSSYPHIAAVGSDGAVTGMSLMPDDVTTNDGYAVANIVATSEGQSAAFPIAVTPNDDYMPSAPFGGRPRPGGRWIPFISSCPEGHYLAGLALRTGALLDRIQLLCRSLLDQAPAVTTGAAYGGGGGNARTIVCPVNELANEVVWRAGDDIDRIELHCAAVSTAVPTGSVTAWGGNGGSPHTHTCPEAGFLTEIHGVYGTPMWSASATVIRQLGFSCGYPQ